MLRALVYCRVSSDRQVKNFSLPVQLRACREYCEREGMQVVKEFVEEGESAKTQDRPKLQELLKLARTAKGVTHVVVYTLDRLAREQYDHQVLRRYFATRGIEIRSVAEPIDNSPIGKATFGMLSVMSQFDNDVRAMKTKAGMVAASEKGRWCHRAPLGYVNVAEGNRKTLGVDAARARLIRKAFELYATGLYTQNDVLQQVTEMGLRTRTGKPVAIQTFTQLLRNPIYLGKVRVAAWGVDVPGDFPPLVEAETYWKVQVLLAGAGVSVTPHERNRPDFPLRGAVKCEVCGKALTSSWSTGKGGRRYPYYHCPAKSGCKSTKIRAEKLEGEFLSLLDRLRPRQAFMGLFQAIVLDVWRQKQGDVITRRQGLEKKVQELVAKRERLDRRFVFEEAIDRDTYDRLKGELEAERLDADLRLHSARLGEVDIEATLDFALYLVTHASRLWLQAELDQRQRLQKVLFPEGILVSKDGVRTPVSGSFYEYLGEIVEGGSRMVAHTGFEPVLPA